MLDLMIARLTTIAAERDAQPAPTVEPPRGLRVPVRPALPSGAPKPNTKLARKP
jgi:hypothetical protein